MAKTTAPQVPGETAETSTDQAQGATGSEENVTIPKSQLEEIMARLNQLESSNSKPAARIANPEANLPDQDTIDAETIKGPVLTKQGWIVPKGYGEVTPAKK